MKDAASKSLIAYLISRPVFFFFDFVFFVI